MVIPRFPHRPSPRWDPSSHFCHHSRGIKHIDTSTLKAVESVLFGLPRLAGLCLVLVQPFGDQGVTVSPQVTPAAWCARLACDRSAVATVRFALARFDHLIWRAPWTASLDVRSCADERGCCIDVAEPWGVWRRWALLGSYSARTSIDACCWAHPPSWQARRCCPGMDRLRSSGLLCRSRVPVCAGASSTI